MITYVKGNLFLSPAQVLVNTVNTVGVMGKGIALEFKNLYPEMFAKYRQLCESGELTIGKLWLYKSPNKWVLNFPTKEHWRQPSRPEYIEAGLQNFARHYARLGIHSIAFPALGSGNGQLDFETQVKPLMERYLAPLPIDIYIYPEGRTTQTLPEHLTPTAFHQWLRTEPVMLPFSEVWDDLQRLLSTPRQFQTLAAHPQLFSAELTLDSSGICVHTPEEIAFDHDTLQSFWQQLRATGFITSEFATGINGRLVYLGPLFAALNYVSAVQVAHDTLGLRQHPMLGLQLMPAATAQSRPTHQFAFEL